MLLLFVVAVAALVVVVAALVCCCCCCCLYYKLFSAADVAISSVTRFGEISSLRQNAESIRQFLKAKLSVWAIFEPILANVLSP